MSDGAPPPAPQRKRPRFEPIRFGAAFRSSGLVVYGVLVAAMVGVAMYNYSVQDQPLTSVYVAGPAIGALWFALRVFMLWGSRK